MRVRCVRLLRYCTACNTTTEQVRLNGDNVWRCQRCGTELTEKETPNATDVRPYTFPE